MKTYNLVACIIMAFSFAACDKSTEESSEELSMALNANYTVFLKSNNQLTATILGSAKAGLVVQNAATNFKDIPLSSFKFRTVKEVSYYYTSNCRATVQIYNAVSDTSTMLSVFEDIDSCSIEVTAIAHTKDELFVSYEQAIEGKDKQYIVRSISLSSDGSTFIDIVLDKKPVDLMPSSNRLFVMTSNEYVTDEFHLSIIDLKTKENLMELDLGNDATKLLKNISDQIIISYPELHTTLNPITLDKKYTMYGEGTAPGFLSTIDSFMDGAGRIYFQKTIPSAIIATVPAIYDFDKNSTVVYLFENFLSESELNVKYSIAATTSISYDEENGYVLIGYQKKGQVGNGGILRISPTPDFKIIDNIDLEGVPQSIFVN
ncbi:hypothetical protein [Maribacter sp. ACAM166]|uniref:hypothetical protein n=1 Tax=Maribacter sp. ACAM166 TaxID=2508996 RepID=UPI0010FDA763|nr:hypothetical protein [Maribacter sp. ACAM166]TLP81314.1 hypothetical protein ES765_04705 [Maribacter sp. ACAM166]